MNRIITGSVAAVALVGGIAFGVAAPAGAAELSGGSGTTTPKSLSDIQAAGAKATSARIASLGKDITKITANTCVSESDKSTILGTFNADVTAMQGLATTIAADTDATKAASDYRSIFDTYRVYSVAIPQAHYAAAADCISSKSVPALTAAQTKLTAALTKHPDKSTPAVQAAMADLATQIAAAQSAVNGVAASALGVTPADYNSNKSVLSSEKSSVSTAVAAVKAAHADAKTVLAALK
jgi:hypothetical protein